MLAGRPSKLNEELISNMCDEIADGLPVKYTCDLFGVTQPSFHGWMKKGEEDINADKCDTIHAIFFMSIKKAQSEYVREAKKNIRSGRNGWQGEAWWLERTRNDFMPRQVVESNTEDGKVTVVFGGKVKDVKKDTAE